MKFAVGDLVEWETLVYINNYPKDPWPIKTEPKDYRNVIHKGKIIEVNEEDGIYVIEGQESDAGLTTEMLIDNRLGLRRR